LAEDGYKVLPKIWLPATRLYDVITWQITIRKFISNSALHNTLNVTVFLGNNAVRTLEGSKVSCCTTLLLIYSQLPLNIDRSFPALAVKYIRLE
jgi:hypothetical protein